MTKSPGVFTVSKKKEMNKQEESAVSDVALCADLRESQLVDPGCPATSPTAQQQTNINKNQYTKWRARRATNDDCVQGSTTQQQQID